MINARSLGASGETASQHKGRELPVSISCLALKIQEKTVTKGPILPAEELLNELMELIKKMKDHFPRNN